MQDNSIGTFISILRKERGLTQKELAEKLNVSDKAVSRWENGESYPDLMLVPVIAGIFEVTADELLKGERKENAERFISAAKNTNEAPEHSLSDYNNKTAVSLGIAFFGLGLAAVVNFAVLKSMLAFGLSLLMLIISAVCHTVFSNSMLSSLSEEAYSVKDKRKLKNRVNMIYCVIFSVFLFCLPLAINGGKEYGLDFMSWVYPGAAITAIFFIILLIVNSIYCLKSKNGEFSKEQKYNAKLKIKITAVLCVCVAVSIISAFFINDYVMFVKGTEIETEDEFVEFMKTYKEDEAEAYDGEEYEQTVRDSDDNTIFSYPMNDNIAVINFNERSDGKNAESYFPCKIYTTEDLIQRGGIVDKINIGFIFLYIAEAVLTFVIYFKKKRKS